VILRGDSSRRAFAGGAVIVAALLGCASRERREDAIAAAVARAERYLQARGPRIDPLMTYVLARLERRYGLAWTAQQRDGALAAAAASPQLGLFRRLVDPQARPDPGALATIENQSDRLILSALYCRELGAPPAADLETFARKPGADVAHGALALQWLVENGCLTREAAAPLRQLFVDELVTEIAQAPAVDVGIESTAMLEYVGAADRIQPAWVDAILAAQHPDGGWGERPPDPSNDHTTALALWVLLAQSGRPRVDVPWVPQ